MSNIINFFHNHKKLFSLIVVALFFATLFSSIPISPSHPPNNVSPFASNSPSNHVYANTSVSYYTCSYSSKNATQTVTFNQVQGAGNTISLDLSPSDTSTTKVTFTDSISSMEFYSPSGMSLYFEISTGETSSGIYSWGTAYFNVTAPNGDTYNLLTYSINNYASTSGNSPWLYAVAFTGYPDNIPSQSGSWTLTFVLTSDPGQQWDTADSSFQVITEDHSSGDEYDVSELSQNTQTWSYQWTFNSQTVDLSLPQYTTAFKIATENAQYSTDADYNGATESVPYNFTGSLSATSIEFIPEASPDVSSWTVQYYIYDLYWAVPASTVESASATGNYTMVSSNEGTYSFSFSGSTPSSAYFADYMDSSGNIVSTDVVFSPNVTVSNPYYSYAQNELTASISGASSG